ncbi:hypothetical protein MACK_002399 [Theileria orientalis]|uniref:Uncharacterized protein n=1 Tax=Theileria orientalis TaxID=68886 RepID=A0A976MBZ7_THEOR|nr:hypothetical protein MACK_002399 [Theileria orientalis]
MHKDPPFTIFQSSTHYKGMNTLIVFKALILVAFSAKFVRSEDTGDDIGSIYDSSFPDLIIEDSDSKATKESDNEIAIEDSRDAKPIVPVIPEDKDEDIFDRNHGSFPDGWHTYQGGNQLRGVEVPAKIEERDDDGSVPAKIEEKKDIKEKKTKAGEKKIKRDSGMPVGAIAVMVTAGSVLVVAVAVAITIRK